MEAYDGDNAASLTTGLNYQLLYSALTHKPKEKPSAYASAQSDYRLVYTPYIQQWHKAQQKSSLFSSTQPSNIPNTSLHYGNNARAAHQLVPTATESTIYPHYCQTQQPMSDIAPLHDAQT